MPTDSEEPVPLPNQGSWGQTRTVAKIYGRGTGIAQLVNGLLYDDLRPSPMYRSQRCVSIILALGEVRIGNPWGLLAAQSN